MKVAIMVWRRESQGPQPSRPTQLLHSLQILVAATGDDTGLQPHLDDLPPHTLPLIRQLPASRLPAWVWTMAGPPDWDLRESDVYVVRVLLKHTRAS